MLFRQWDAWRRRRAQEYLSLAPEQRYRKHQYRQIGAIVTLPAILLATGSIAAAYGSGLFTKETVTATCQPTIVSAPKRASFELRVLNATGEGGRATAVGKEMAKRGFTVTDMSTAPEALYVRSAAVLYHGAKGRDQALLVQSQVPGSRLFDDGRANTRVDFVIGSGYEGLVAPPPRVMPRPSEIKVNVYNTTWREGLASRAQDALTVRGFRPGKKGNDPDGAFLPDEVALIRYGPDADLAALRLAQHVKGAKLVKIEREGLTLDLVVGNRYRALVDLADVPPLPPVRKGPGETVARPCAED